MARPCILSCKPIALVLLAAFMGCHTASPRATPASPAWKTVPPSIQVPLNIERLAILYPKTYNKELLDAYTRLEGLAFQLKELRPFLRIVDRFNLDAVLGEQRFQVGGAVSDESAIRLGRLLGVDGILLYRIEGPTLRDRFFSKYYGDLPPYVVTSKIIMVESAEVVFHNVVTTPVGRPGMPMPFFFNDPHMDVQVRAALDHGIAQTTEDLRHAFR
ncbi:MAG: hypothetical protein HY581_04025 [Nitrospirae bacterium]|nr:hypothetical protein [Nitrospirota bacterium]